MKKNRVRIFRWAPMTVIALLGAFQNCTGGLADGVATALAQNTTNPVRTRSSAVGDQTYEAFRDQSYEAGFNVYFNGPKIGTLRGSDPTPQPIWNFYQWNSQQVLGLDGGPQGDGGYQWATAYNAVTLMPNGHVRIAMASTSEWSTYLARNPSLARNDIVENGAVIGQLPAQAQPWPALLLHQDFFNPYRPTLPSLAHLRRADLDFTAQLLYNSVPLPETNPNNVAAQIPMFFGVQNLNKSSPYFGEYIQINVPILDSRVPFPVGMILDDVDVNGKEATSWMYSPGYLFYAATSLQSYQPVRFQKDILPYSIQALLDAMANDRLKSRDINDFYFAGMTVGWEMPGLDIATFDIGPMSLKLRADSDLGTTIAVTGARYATSTRGESCLAPIVQACNGQTSCSVPSSNDFCGADPAPGVVKRLSVSYVCSDGYVGSAQADEGGSLTLACGSSQSLMDDMKWSFAGPMAGMTCVQVNEPSDADTWADNYLCTSRDWGLRWSFAGPIGGMTCTQINEPSDPDAWDDNYLCAPVDYGLKWSYAGALPNRTCVQVNEPSDPHTWNDNFLCGPEK